MIEIRPAGEGDKAFIKQVMIKEWGDETVVVHRTVYKPHELPGFIAADGSSIKGLLTYNTDENGLEIVTLNAFDKSKGIGTSLTNKVKVFAKNEYIKRIWLITTNDNEPAIGFYEKNGFSVCAVHKGAVNCSRKIKPSIPLTGVNGIPIEDEIEMEMFLK